MSRDGGIRGVQGVRSRRDSKKKPGVATGLSSKEGKQCLALYGPRRLGTPQWLRAGLGEAVAQLNAA